MVHPGLRVGELAELIDNQEILLPDFQRSYVWHRPQVLKFLDSLYRGYPVGQILLWIPPAETVGGNAPLGRPLGTPQDSPGVPAVPPSGGSARPFVLDGQQRLTTLYRILRSQEGSHYRFNVADEIFQHDSSALAKDPRWVDVGELLRSDRGLPRALVRLQRELKLAPDDATYEGYQVNLQRLSLVRERVLPVQLVRLSDPESVAELFVRINSGTPLRRAELALAQLAWRWPGALVSRIQTTLEEFEEREFDLSAPFVMRCFVAVSTGQAGFQHTDELWKLNDVTLTKNWEKTHMGLRASLAFVQEVARLGSGREVPSTAALLPITALFANQVKTDAAQTLKLLYWFLVASAYGRYGSSVETRLNEDLKAIHSSRPLDSLLEILAKTTPAPAEVKPADLEGRGSGSSVFVLLLTAARFRGIHDWFAPSPKAKPLGERELVTFPLFGRGELAEAGLDPELSEEVANLVLLPHRPPARSTLPAKTDEILGKLAPALLAEQAVPKDKTLWYVGKAEAFLEARRELLARSATQMLAALHAGTTPNLSG